MASQIPVKFLTILLILDFTIGLGIVYQDDVIEFANFDDFDCETSKSHVLIGPKWQSFPIRYYIDISVPQSFRSAIQASLNVWEELTPVTIFQRIMTPENMDLIIGYADLSFFEGAVGVTGLEGNDEFFGDGFIKQASLLLNTQEEFANIEFSCDLVPLDHRGPFDIEAVTVHELGHVLGLDHTVDEFATMYPFYIGTFSKTLAQGDINGFFDLYDSLLP
ncbi:MAG: matrixin family metalloprotease [Candidatus Heimdallarchaeota archaeon]|nr:matrixin family metalloprotease [Candidatus Heimdallarchaeota archaeon]